MPYPSAPQIGIGIVLIRGDEVLLVKRGKPPGMGAWSLPGGRQELGETAEDAARRELREETGLECGPLILAGHADSIHCDDAGRVAYHYTILDFAGLYAGGDAAAADDAADIAWARLAALEAYGLTADARRIIAQAFALLRP